MDRAHRLTSARDFRRVMSQGRRARSKAILCVIARTDSERPPRVGIRSPRNIGSAVSRNRANRRLRAVLRGCVDALPPGTDAIVTALPRAATMDFQELADEVRVAMSRAGATC